MRKILSVLLAVSVCLHALGLAAIDIKAEPSGDYKFAVEVSSKDSTGNTALVGLTVAPDFRTVLRFEGEKVNTSNVRVDVWMKNVASLNVSGERHYYRSLNTGMEPKDVELTAVSSLLAGFEAGNVTVKVVGGSSTAVSLKKDSAVLFSATPDSNASKVWHEIVNSDTVKASTKADEDAYFFIPKGSYVQVADMILSVDKDLRVDNLNDLNAVNQAIRAAVSYKKAAKEIDNIVAYLEKGTVLALGQSVAESLLGVTVTVDVPEMDLDKINGHLEELQKAQGISALFSPTFKLIKLVAESLNGKSSTVTIGIEEPEEDYKFKMQVSSKASDGKVGLVRATVYPDYLAKLIIEGQNVNTSNVKLDVWMKNVASLGVTSERHYERELQTGMGNKDVSLQTVVALFSEFNSGTVVAKVVGGDSGTYQIVKAAGGREFTATPDENIRKVWHQIVNKTNITAGTKSEDAYIILPKGSYVQIKDMVLAVDVDDLKIDKLNDLSKVIEEVRRCITFREAEEAIEDIVIYLEPDTELALGSSNAVLNLDARIEVEIPGYDLDKLNLQLTELRDAQQIEQMIRKVFEIIKSTAAAMDGNTATVTFQFDHIWGEPEYTWINDDTQVRAYLPCLNNPEHDITEIADVKEVITKPATCTVKGEKELVAEFEDEHFEKKTKKVEIEALGHIPGLPVYEWSDDHLTCTATIYCIRELPKADASTGALHTREDGEAENTCHAILLQETVNAKVDEQKTTCTQDGKTTYTAEFTHEEFETQVVTVDGEKATGHDYVLDHWEWEKDYSAATAVFVCQNDPEHVERIQAEVTSEPEEEDPEIIRYTATVQFEGSTYSDEKIVDRRVPSTGDSADRSALALTAFASLAAMAAVIYLRKRED
ncbi:MAG: hypothetical protein II712_04465 [Erysipelotrichaceae bacterium]|nr:hypothetical protein [Erysipelotrichaceae bacterium]